MLPFSKPGASLEYDVMGANAAAAALEDAGVTYTDVEQAYAGYVYGDSSCGQAAVYRLGLTGIPVFNVNSNCSSGSSALYLARQAVESGVAECVLAVGFEQMPRGALGQWFGDRPSPLGRFEESVAKFHGWDESVPFALQFFGQATEEHIRRYGTDERTLARIVVKARQHAAANPKAVFREAVTEEQVLSSPAVFGSMTRLQCCPPTCGAAAAVLCSAEFARRHGLQVAVKIAAQVMTTDGPTTFDGGDSINVIGYDMTRKAALAVYEKAGIGPEDIPVVELHDCFAINELITYEALGLIDPGEGDAFVADGCNTYGGQVVVNPSGGLLAKGHPLGATGLAQCAELVWQLRGQAGDRQVQGAHHGLQHNIGLGGACVVTLYEKV
jgi:acetyl-CoA acetyltransferase